MREFFGEVRQYITPANTVIIVLCIAVFIADLIIGRAMDADLLGDYGALGWAYVIEDHEYYRILTYMFLHGGISHLFGNMLVLLFVGSTVEKVIGSVKYLINYICSGLVAGIVSVYYNLWLYNHTVGAYKQLVVSVGASGAIFGTVGALFWLVIANRGRIEGISTGRIILFIVFSIFEGFTAAGIDNAAHVGGLLFGFISAVILYDKRRRWQ